MRSISPWPRATAGQWMREAGEPGRCSRRPSSSVSAAAISAARAWAGVASPPPAVARTGSTRGSTRISSVPWPVTTRWASPNGSRSTSAGGASRRRPRRPKVTSTRTRAAGRPARKRTGSGSSGSSIQPGGSGIRPAVARIRTSSGCSSSTLRAPSSRLTCAPHAPAPIQPAAPRPSSASAEPVTYSGSASNVPATTSSSTPSAAQPSAERMALERRRGRDRVGHDRSPLDARRLGHEHEPVGQDGPGRAPARRRAARGRGPGRARAPWRRAAASGRRAARRRARRGRRRACAAARATM